MLYYIMKTIYLFLLYAVSAALNLLSGSCASLKMTAIKYL